MPIPSDYKEMIAAIYKASDEGRVKWRRKNNEYVVNMPDARIMVHSGFDSVRRIAFTGFNLFDANNKLLDGWSVRESEEDYHTMHLLMMSAKRCVEAVPTTLDTLKERFLTAPSIGDDGDAGEKPAERYGT